MNPPIQPTAEHRKVAEEAIKEAVGEKWLWPRMEEILGKVCWSNLKICVADAISKQEKKAVKKALKEHDGYCQAAKLLFDRMKPWEQEWKAAHPDKPLTWPDFMTLIEWKMASREALAAYSASQEVLRSVEEADDCENGMDCSQSHASMAQHEVFVEAAKTACEKFPKP